MNLKKIIPVSVVLISAIFLGAFFVYENNEPKEKLIIATSYEILKSFHYSPQNLDDTYSERVFNLYMKSLDYNKMFALITYKNLFPRDFSDLQLNKGFVYSLFDNNFFYYDL